MNDFGMVSVIVPVYNAECTIEKCVHSISNQSYPNLEIVLVNDGSVDNSLAICCLLAEKDKRIRIIEQLNQGVSAARNTGLRTAKGVYCCFVDSDDWIESRHVELMAQEIANSDCVLSGYIRNEGDREELCKLNANLYDLQALDDESIISVFKDGFIHPCWNKLFKLEIIHLNNLYFDTFIHISEDSLFCIAYLRHCNTLKILNAETYHYFISSQSSLSKKVYNNIFEIYEKVYLGLGQLLIQCHCCSELIEKITVQTIYPQLYNSVLKIYADKSKDWKEKKRLLIEIKRYPYFEYVLRKEQSFLSNTAEKMVIQMMISKQFLLLGGLLKCISRKK